MFRKGSRYQISSLYHRGEFIIYTLKRTIGEISFREASTWLETIFRRKIVKNLLRRVEGSGLYANECTVIHESKEEEVSGERERERERKERDVVSERRPRASRPSPLYRRPRRSHLSSSPRFTTSFLAGPRPRVRVSTRYVFDLCAHLLALNAGGEGNRFRAD